MPVITFEHVTKTYPGQKRPALHDVSATIDDGEFVFLVGPSGSGKSTFLRLVLREYRATEGSVVVNGRDVGKLRNWRIPKLRRNVGIVFQDFRLLPGKTVSENVAFTLQVIGRPSREIRTLVPETLELVGLADKGDRLPEELSGGEQQRVAIARAFVNRPGILLADEPTGNLDRQTGDKIADLLFSLNREYGTTLILVTHDAQLAARCDRRLRLVNGQLQEEA